MSTNVQTPPSTALARIEPVSLPAIDPVEHELVKYRATADEILKWAEGLMIASGEVLGEATAKLGEIGAANRTADTRRKDWVRPANDYAASVNATVRYVVEPLGKAETIVKDKILAWHRSERDRVAREEQQRRAAADEAQRVAREAEREATRIREEAARAATPPPAPPTPAAPAAEPETLEEYYEQIDNAPRVVLEPKAHQPSLQDAVQATAYAEQLRRDADQASFRAAEPVAPPPKTITAPGGATAQVKHGPWTYTIKNLADVPRAYLCVDNEKVLQAVRLGAVREIAGLDIFQPELVASSSGRKAPR